MTSWKIYHNPKCSKSRQTLALLEENGIQPEIVKYLDNAPNESELTELLQFLQKPASEIVRTKEELFRTDKFDIADEATVIKNLAIKPKLLERPIVVRDKRAVIGRPPENVLSLL